MLHNNSLILTFNLAVKLAKTVKTPNFMRDKGCQKTQFQSRKPETKKHFVPWLDNLSLQAL